MNSEGPGLRDVDPWAGQAGVFVKRQRLNTTDDLQRGFNNLALAILGDVGRKVGQSVGGPSVGSQSETIL